MARPDTAGYLRSLLADHLPYRRQWRSHMKRATRENLHQGAIARVIAHHLWETGQAAESAADLPRRLRDRVSRALSGELLSVQTLTWFIDAFGMAEMHAATLWRHFRNDAVAPGVEAPGPSAGAREGPGTDIDAGGDRRPVSRDAFDLLVLDEFHQIGPDGVPVAHQTFQIIRAVEQIERYSLHVDAATASVEVTRGGSRGRAYPHPDDAGTGVIDIDFPRRLEPGETIAVEYRLTFSYPQAPERRFRRLFMRPVPSVTMQIRFDPRRRPARVWWSRWPDLESGPSESEDARLESDGTVYRFVEKLEPSLVGFRWEWGEE